MDYIPLSDNAARQVIDSTTVFDELRRVNAETKKYLGGMYWKRTGDREYLVKTLPDNRQRSLGPRSEGTERIHADFTTRKHDIEKRSRSLRKALIEAERMNKALKAGRTPAIVISLLQTLHEAELDQHFIVVGTHALYAYETAAGVRIVQGALATQDVDLLWDARKRVQFMTDLKKVDGSMLQVLRRADPTFKRKDRHNETAINDKGFEVDFLRRMQIDDDPHPAPLFEHPVSRRPAAWRACALSRREASSSSNAGWPRRHRSAPNPNAGATCARRRSFSLCSTKDCYPVLEVRLRPDWAKGSATDPRPRGS